MHRRLESLNTTESDLLIIGGGIYGAWAAWEAASRGLSVVLVEQSDFGGATSANSQKIVHGGFRYLQSLDFKRMRESIRERRALFRVAPHLVQKLPCVMPTYKGKLMRSKFVMRLALAIYDCVAWDRNAGVNGRDHQIPRGRILSRDECLRLLPGIPAEGLTGGALWYDGQLLDSERLTLAVVRSAANAGASVFNYVRVTGLLREGGRIKGIKAVDQISGDAVEMRARLVMNTAGPWIEHLLNGLNGRRSPAKSLRWLKVVNLILRLPMAQGVAAALPVRTLNSQIPGLLFITPWHDRTIAGSTYTVFEGRPEDYQVTEQEVTGFIDAINASYPALRVSRQQVERVHVGIMPAQAGIDSPDSTAPRRHYQIRDHARTQQLEGLVSVLGVKYTTARDVAAKAVGLAFKKLGRGGQISQSDRMPLLGGKIRSVDALLNEVISDRPWNLSAAVIRELVTAYGSEYVRVIKLIRENLIWAEPVVEHLPVIKAQIAFAVREEMAQTLEDVIFRRTNMGALGYPGADAIEACADLMSTELGWDEARRQKEIAAVHHTFQRLGWRVNGMPASGLNPLESAQAQA